MDRELNCLSYWFPKIEAAGLPVPKTEIVRLEDDSAMRDIFRVFDGEEIGPNAVPFMESVADACDRMGYPCFLRTGQGSGKHEWKNTCFIPDRQSVIGHVVNLIEWSECVDFMGLPWNVWCVRELLPTMPRFRAFADMPICTEFRFFVRDGRVICSHPYWPADSIEGHGPSVDDWRDKLRELSLMSATEADDLYRLAGQAGEAVGGDWSVDMIETKRGWFVTDMAVAQRSFHWPGCQHESEFASADK